MYQLSLNLNSLQQKFSLTLSYLGTNSVVVKRVDCKWCMYVGYYIIAIYEDAVLFVLWGERYSRMSTEAIVTWDLGLTLRDFSDDSCLAKRY